jgi:hypothetical protein
MRPTHDMDTFNKAAEVLAATDGEPALPCEPEPVVNGLRLRSVLGRKVWGVPRPYGCCGWVLDKGDGADRLARVIVTGDHLSDDVNWIHASISYVDRMPDYDDLKLLHAAVFDTGWAYQVFAPPSEHVNIHAHALHLFGRADGARVLPDFGRFGSI